MDDNKPKDIKEILEMKPLHELDKPLMASERMWTDFQESAVWVDMKNYLMDLQSELVRLLVNPDITNNMSMVKEMQAAFRVCDYMLGLPERFIEEIRLSKGLNNEPESN